MSVARAADFPLAFDAGTIPFCQISTVFSNDAFKLPGLGGSYFFTDGVPSGRDGLTDNGTFIEGQAVGKARVVGTITDDGAPARKFAVDLVVEGRLNADDPGYGDTCRAFFLRTPCGSTDEWHVYTALSGTLTGLLGSDVDGAVYNVSLGTPPLPPDTASRCDDGDPANPVFQVGLGANTHSTDPGAFAPLNLVLAQDNGMGLPAVTDGEISLRIATTTSFPPTPTPSPTGTWQGSIDCAGVADFTDTETFSGPVVLKVGARSGVSYGVELSDGSGGVIATYCGDFANEIRVNSDQGAGQLFNNDPAAPSEAVFLKVRNTDPATLKARELLSLPDGSDAFDFPEGLNFCKWSFTQTNPAEPDPPIPAVCSSAGCGNGLVELGELCDDGNSNEGDSCPNTCLLCGNGLLEPLLGEQCDHNNTVSGDGCSSTCQIESP